ncbi:phytochrome-like protein cph1 [Sporocytophaga myxococcoides]|uniref:histidine kinase n=1 Tax=Sporocytophaga myxococcoides TaxID=153721 RepID=A0A098L8C1_9BACT|nr:PAS domain-containing sensor histidine kinase [Sporocytophaga myxococcoides]GAL82935.1 phytochrome-like protein cph1 [Sporocytophaga myxococcoides]
MHNRKKTLNINKKRALGKHPLLRKMILRIKAEASEFSTVKAILNSIFSIYSTDSVIILIEDNFKSKKVSKLKKFLFIHNRYLHKIINQSAIKAEKVYLIPSKSQIEITENTIKITRTQDVIFEDKISFLEIANGKVNFTPASYTHIEENTYKIRHLRFCISKLNRINFENKGQRNLNNRKIEGSTNLISSYILENIIDSTNLIIVGVSENGIIQIYNKAAEVTSGFSRKEMIGKKWFDYVTPKDVYKYYAGKTKRNLQSFETSLITKSGEEKIIHWQINEVHFGGELVGSIALGMDISGLIKYINKLNEGHEKFKALEENKLFGIVRRSPYGKYISANQTFCQLTEYSLNEITKLTLDVLTYHEDLDKERVLIDQLISGEISTYKIEKRLITKSGKVIWVEVNAAPYKNLYGKIEYFIIIIENIDQRKNAEYTLKQNEIKYKILADNPTIGFAFSDDRGFLIESNEAFHKMLGYQKNELLGRHFKDFTYHEDAKREAELLEKISTGEINDYQIEKRYMNKNKDVFWVDMNLSTVRNEKNEIQYFICITQNIDTRKKAEEALKQSEEQYRFLANTVPQIFWSADEYGIVNFFNKKWIEFTGLSVEESINNGWLSAIYPEDMVSTEKEWYEAVNQGIKYEKELRLMNKEGKYKWFLSKATPLKDAKGNIIKWFGTSMDIHDLKIAIQNLEDAYKELKKANVDLDNFIYTASHDLKAPVSNIEGLVTYLDQLLKEMYSPNEQNGEVESLIDMMYQSLAKFKKTIEDLSDVTKAQGNGTSKDLTEINLYDALEEAKITLMNDINNSKCIITYQLTAPEIKFSIKDFRSILYNLLSNAIKYRSRKRKCRITIKTYYQKDAIVLEVKDNGIGISPKNQEGMFQIFRRVHNQKLDVDGTGVGLYILKRIMDNNNGSIQVESEVDKGSTFRLIFSNQKNNL